MFSKKTTEKAQTSVSLIPTQNPFHNVEKNPFSKFQLNHKKKKVNKASKQFSSQELKQALKEHYSSNLFIKRLFYPDNPMPIRDHYVTLSILPGVNYQNQLTGNMPQTEDIYEVSTQLYGHELGLITPDSLMPIGAKNTPCQVLVLGTAGVGKSTLSERLCYLWSVDGNRVSNEYDWVFRIPLRNLTAERYPEKDCNIIDVIERECLSLTKVKQLSPDIKKLLGDVLFHAVEKRVVLLILDGLDELSEEIPPKLSELLKDFMSSEQIILTSRPYNVSGLKQKYGFNSNYSYEITGFADAHIEKYVHDFFQYLPDKKPEEPQHVLSFLKQNRNVAGICRIPINLELFCSAWEKQRIPQGYYSVTAIYEVVTRSLCHRYLEREGQRKKIGDMDDALILESCKLLLVFLEHLGYQSASTNKVFLNVSPTCQYLRESNENLNEHNFLLEQKSFGFIRPSNSKNEYDGVSLYYFNHLTFRDYFAARFLAQCFQSSYTSIRNQSNFSHTWLLPGGMSLETFLRKKRFEPHYEFIWWFMAGTLAGKRDVLAFKKFLSIFLAEEDKTKIGRFLLLIRCLDEASEINDELPQGLWNYVESWFEYMFQPFFSLILLHEQSEIINKLKISPSVFLNHHIQSFFCEKIQLSDSIVLQKFLDFFFRLGLPLPKRLDEALLERLIRLKITQNRTELKFRQDLIQRMGFLYQKKCLSLELLRQKYRECSTLSEESALITAIFLCSGASPEDTIDTVAFRQTMYQSLLTQDKPLSERIAAASILGNAYELGVFLLLKQSEGHYLSWNMNNFFILDSSKNAINILTPPILQKLQEDVKSVDFEFRVLLQKLEIKFVAPFFEPFLFEENGSMKKKLTVFLCWICSLKTQNTPHDLTNLNLILKEFERLLKNPDLESEAEDFSEFLAELFSPATPFVFKTFATVKEQLCALFLRCFNEITAIKIKKHIALILSCYYVSIPDYQRPTIFNAVIHATYSNEEFIKLSPKMLAMGSLPKLVSELSFCNRDCTAFLEELALDGTTNSYSLFLFLNKTPTRSILKFSMKLLEKSEEGFCHLMTTLILRYLLVGKAFYLNEEGICYFEDYKYQVFPLSADKKQKIESLVNQVVVNTDYLRLPVFPQEIIERLSPSDLSKSSQTKETKNSRKRAKNRRKETETNTVINNNISIESNSNVGNNAGSKNTNISESAVAFNHGHAENRIIRHSENKLNTITNNTVSKSNDQLNPKGEFVMPTNTIVPSYYEYASMSDYAYLDLEKEAEKKQSLRSKLDEDWEIIENPEGKLESGYVGAIFIHHTRKQIVIAHAGTLPSRVKTLLADTRGVVNKGADPLVLGALMQSQGKEQASLKELVEKEGYHLSFTGHSLGGFLAEMSVYACHRGFGLHYPEASAVVFDSPGSLEVIQVWESHNPLHQIGVKKLNIISFLSSPNLVNTAHSHPGTIYRLIRDIPLGTFESYLLASHDRKALFALFNSETGYPEDDSWIEMEDWPLADYEELLSLKDHPVSHTLDLVVTKPVQLVSGLTGKVWGLLTRSPSKVSLTRLFGGKEPRNLWELLNSKQQKNYHLVFDTSTSEGLKDAIQTHYFVKNSVSTPLAQRLPLVNFSPLVLAFLEFHEQHQNRPFYKDYVKNSELAEQIKTLPAYHVDKEKGYIHLMSHSQTGAQEDSNNIRQLQNVLAEMFNQNSGRTIIANWAQDYTAYLEHIIKKIEDTSANTQKQLTELEQQSSRSINTIRKELNTELEASREKLNLLSKELQELKTLREEAVNQPESSSLFAFAAAIAEKPGSKANTKIRRSEKSHQEMLDKSIAASAAEQDKDRAHPDYAPPKHRRFVIDSAVAEASQSEATTDIELGGDVLSIQKDKLEEKISTSSSVQQLQQTKEKFENKPQWAGILTQRGMFSPINSREFVRKAENYCKEIQDFGDEDMIAMRDELGLLLQECRKNIINLTSKERNAVREKINEIEKFKSEILEPQLQTSQGVSNSPK